MPSLKKTIISHMAGSHVKHLIPAPLRRAIKVMLKVEPGKTFKLERQNAALKAANQTLKTTISRQRDAARSLQEQHRTLKIKVASQALAIQKVFADPPADWTLEQQVFLIHTLQRLDLLSERVLHILLSRLFFYREMELFHSIIADAGLEFDLVREFHRTRFEVYVNNSSVPLHEISDLYRRANDSFLRWPILNEFLAMAVRIGEVDQIERTLAELDKNDYQRISRPTIKGVVRLLIQNERSADAVRILDGYLHQAKEDQLLSFLEPLMRLDHIGVLPPRLHDFCSQFQEPLGPAVLTRLGTFYQAVDEADRDTFNRFLIEPLSTLMADDHNLMDVRFSQQQRRLLVERIKADLAERKPLSLIRLGDGEAYAYPIPEVQGNDSRLFDPDNAFRERLWWDASPPPHVRDDIVRRVRRAVERCDILGLPSVYRIIRDLPPSHIRCTESRALRSYMIVLGALSSMSIGEKTLTEERCNHCALNEAVLVELAAVADSTVIVSCWTEDQVKCSIPFARYINISPHRRVKNLVSTQVPPLFENYLEIVERVRAVSGPGVLVLVGAGIIGKILADEARSAGSVALDVGSVMDYLAGHKTRSIADLGDFLRRTSETACLN